MMSCFVYLYSAALVIVSEVAEHANHNMKYLVSTDGCALSYGQIFRG